MEKDVVDEYGHHHGEGLFQNDLHTVIDCKACGYAHISPLPTSEQHKSFYEEEYYQSEKVEYFQDADENHEWLQIDYGSRLDLVSKALGGVGSVLDIGCGPGSFLREAKEKGWAVTGIEPSTPAFHYANEYDLNVIQGFFPHDSAFKPASFDFVHLSMVLEHVPQPLDMLKSIYDLVRPGGYITVSSPNDFNSFQAAAVKSGKIAPWWVLPGHHLNYFNFKSLENLLRKTGFDITDSTTDFPMELFLLMGEDYTTDPALGKICHNKRKKLDKKLFDYDESLYGLFYRQLAAAGLGRVVTVTAHRPE